MNNSHQNNTMPIPVPSENLYNAQMISKPRKTINNSLNINSLNNNLSNIILNPNLANTQYITPESNESSSIISSHNSSIIDTSKIFGNTIYSSFVEGENKNNNIANNSNQKCEICLQKLDESDKNNIYELQCKCIHHRNCLTKYIINSIENKKLPLICKKCKKEIHPNVIYEILNANNSSDIIKKYEKYSMDLYVLNHNDEFFSCPTPGCGYVISHEKNAKKFTCPICKIKYCMLCRNYWHENMTCPQYKQYLNKNNIDNDMFNNSTKDKKISQNSTIENYKICPNCQTWTTKENGSNKIKCICGICFCYKCGKIIQNDMVDCPCGL